MNVRLNTALMCAVGLALSLAATAGTETTREERLDRVQEAVQAANERTGSGEAREYIAERGYETRKAVSERNLGENAPPPSRAYDESAQRPSALESTP